jgi:hypothetical protein
MAPTSAGDDGENRRVPSLVGPGLVQVLLAVELLLLVLVLPLRPLLPLLLLVGDTN